MICAEKVCRQLWARHLAAIEQFYLDKKSYLEQLPLEEARLKLLEGA